MDNEIIGVENIKRMLQSVEKVSVSAITKAARAGAKAVCDDARTNAPTDTGALRRGIKYKLEKRKKMKRVYDIGFFGASGKGEEFVKISKTGKRSFYPVSQEYGWIDQYGHILPVKRFLRNALHDNRANIEQMVLKRMFEELSKVKGV